MIPGTTSPSGDGGEGFVEAAVHTVLTAADDEVDVTVGQAALLLACANADSASEHVVRQWRRATGRPVTRLVPDALTARAWAMLFAARGVTPDWAGELPPLDLDAEEHAHRQHLAGVRRRPGVEATLAELAAQAEERAEAGDVPGAREAVATWARVARDTPRPDMATLAGCRRVAVLLTEGALALPESWVHAYADSLVAALHTRYPVDAMGSSWPELIDEILHLRGMPDTAPPPASNEALAEAERRLGVALPDSYRRFLLTCDGLPADVVFPRLLSVSELTTRTTEDGVGVEVVIAEPSVLLLRPTSGEVLEHDPVFGVSVHRDIRALLEYHRRLLEASTGAVDHLDDTGAW